MRNRLCTRGLAIPRRGVFPLKLWAKFLLSFVGVLGVIPVSLGAQAAGGARVTPGAESLLLPIFKDFQSADWRTREGAFYRLVRLGGGDAGYLPRPLGQVLVQFRDQANQIHLQLIALLLKEDYAAYHPPLKAGRWGEDYMNYYGDAIEAVGILGDPRATAALAGAIETGGDATGPLASFGGVALPQVLSRFHQSRLLARYAAVGVMTRMLSPFNRDLLDARDLAEIGGALREAASDTDADVREIAVRGIGELGDANNCAVVRQHMREPETAKVRSAAAGAAKALHCLP